jgi:hypothetical protein
MVGYLKTKKRYFYKLLKTGQKKRYRKKNITKKNKTRKNKKIIGGDGEPIEEGDIMYQDDLVCILRPEVKKGIIIWTRYIQPPGLDSLCNLGLKTGRQLKSEGIEFGRGIFHPYIFFRAPFYSRRIDYSTPETEIISSYGEEGKIRTSYLEPRAFIRVDPDKTFVFSSEIRTEEFDYAMKEDFLNKSKKTLSKYLEIINKNLETEKYKHGSKVAYNLISSEAESVPETFRERFPLNQYPINRTSEILVSIPHLTPDFFVLCTN